MHVMMRESKRNFKNTKEQSGIFLNDYVKVLDKLGFVFGFTSGGCYVKDIFDRYIQIPNKSYKQIGTFLLEVLSHNNNWQFIHHLKEGDKLAGKRLNNA
jgi:lysyl-tRNA synthetase class I